MEYQPLNSIAFKGSKKKYANLCVNGTKRTFLIKIYEKDIELGLMTMKQQPIQAKTKNSLEKCEKKVLEPFKL